MTLVEVLLALGITGVIAGPLLLWSMFAVAQQRRSNDSLTATNGAALLVSHFSRDVPRAFEVRRPGSDCSGSETDGGDALVTLVGGLSEALTTTYVEVERVDDGAPAASVWRRVCGTGGVLLSENELVPAVVADSTRVRCVPATGPSACRQVELETLPSGVPRPITVRAQRRVDEGALNLGSSNRPPRAVIAASPMSGNYPLTVTFSGSGSSDADGPITTWEWEFPDGTIRAGVDQTWTFGEPGQFPVILTVTDAGGATHSAYVTIEATNQPPVARATVTPLNGTLDTVFAFDARESWDPEEGAAIARYQWDFGGGDVQTTTTSTVTHRFPVGTALGQRDVALTVFDAYGASAGVPVRLTIDGRPPVASAITYSPAKLGAMNVRFPLTLSVTGSDPDVTGDGIVAWDWRISTGGAEVWTSTEQTPTLSTAPALGLFQVTVRVKDGSGAWSAPLTDSFMVPPSPSWSNWTISWPAVPGAQSYKLEVNEFTFCFNRTRSWTITPPTVAFTYPDPCWAGISYDARVQVTVNGITSDWSDWSRR